MRLGPIRVTRETTARRLEARLRELELEAECCRAPLFMQYPLHATRPGAVVLPPDMETPASREAVQRVIAAYGRAMAEAEPRARSMWDDIQKRHAAFLADLEAGRTDGVHDALAAMFQGELTAWIGRLQPDIPEEIRRTGRHPWYERLVTDALVSLARCAGILPVSNIEQQGIEAHRRAAEVNVEDLLPRVETRLGLDLGFPEVGGAYGCRIGGKLITLDGLHHGYAVWRVGQMGAEAGARIVEIGGGYGCLAASAFRAGYRDITLFDLPWVNALQGYFLCLALGGENVSLLGEEARGGVRILPAWRFGSLPDRSADFVFNVNSLPEIGREDARRYVKEIGRVLRGTFLSINQESRARYQDYEPQQWVAELADEAGGLQRRSRYLWWMCQGYVEEVYVPADPAARKGDQR